MDEICNKLLDLHFNWMTVDEYESQVKLGRMIRWPGPEDDSRFDQENPNHPLAATSRFRRRGASGYFYALSLEAPEKFELELMEEMHKACEDCYVSVRFDMVRILGYLRNPTSIPVLERIIAKEYDRFTKEAATQALAVVKGDFHSVEEGKYNCFDLKLLRERFKNVP